MEPAGPLILDQLVLESVLLSHVRNHLLKTHIHKLKNKFKEEKAVFVLEKNTVILKGRVYYKIVTNW